MDWLVVLQIVAGAGITIGFVIWVERARKPRLSLKIADPKDIRYDGNRPAQTARYLCLIVENKKLPGLAKWLSRSTAIRCQAVIAFHHLDGQNVFGRSMQARWPSSPQPLPIQAIHPSLGEIKILDPVRLTPEMHRDIHPGEPEKLDVAARFDEEVECYGWCNDNYFSNPIWRNPSWELEHGRYLVKVTVTSASGVSCSALFRLINDVPMSDFRLENALPGDAVQ